MSAVPLPVESPALVMRFCKQVKGDGLRCGSPAMRGSEMCFFHMQQAERMAATETPVEPEQPKEIPPMATILTADIQPNANGKFPCPECPKETATRVALGVHRSQTHGVRGPSAAYWQKHVREAKTKAVPAKQISAKGTAQIKAAQHRRWELALPERAAKLRAKGLSARKIAEKLGKSLPTVYYLLAKTGGVSSNGNSTSHTPKHTSRRTTLSANGRTKTDAVNGTGWTPETLAGYIFAHTKDFIDKAVGEHEAIRQSVTTRVSELLRAEGSGPVGSHLPGVGLPSETA